MVREKRDIEWLVTWALVDNGLGRLFSGGVLQQTGWSDLGTSAQRSAWAVAVPAIKHEDAMAITHAIGMLHPDCAALIVSHGKVGDRPDWVEEGPGAWVQQVDGRGRPMWDWDDPNNRSTKRSGRRPKMHFVGESQKSVDFYRARYDLWWIGLHDMVEPLNGVLARYEATGPDAPDKPWLVGAAPRVFRPDGSEIARPNASAVRLSSQHLRRPKPVQVEQPVQRAESAQVANRRRS